MLRKSLFLLVILLAACAPTPVILATPTSTLHGALTPFLTTTPTRTPVLPTLAAPTPVTPQPSPTPLTHKVVAGETMTGIAIKYGVTLESLLAANPNVQPRMLPVGTILVIPAGGVVATSVTVIPTPTAVPVAASDTLCYPSADGGSWCVLLVTNDQSLPVENLSASIALFNSQGESLAEQVVSAPLDILRPGASIPLLAYFAPALPAQFSTRSRLLTALPIAADDSRYLDPAVEGLQVEITTTARLARLRGQAVLPPGSRPARLLWLAGVAYDAQGDAVGVRKLEISSPCPGAAEGTLTPTVKPAAKVTPTATATPLPCPPIPFDFAVYSLGPPIARVEILLEAR